MNKNMLFTGFICLMLSTGFLAINSTSSIAMSPSPMHIDHNCFSQIELPQNKEELSLDDVRHAVQSYILRIGAGDHKVAVRWFGEDIIEAKISHNGHVLRRLIVDVIEAKIVRQLDLKAPVGFTEPQMGNIDSPETAEVQNVVYSSQLRRHMLGDGHSWANWIGGAKSISCLDDYRYGGPELENVGS